LFKKKEVEIMGGEGFVKDLEGWVAKVKEKGTVAFETTHLKLKKSGLEKKISRLHTRLGERVEYLLDLGRERVEEDEVVKGFLQEIKGLRDEIREIETKVEALKRKESPEGGQTEGSTQEETQEEE